MRLKVWQLLLGCIVIGVCVGLKCGAAIGVAVAIGTCLGLYCIANA